MYVVISTSNFHLFFLALVQVAQIFYQKNNLYRLRALGQRHNMDITVGKYCTLVKYISGMYYNLLCVYEYIGYISSVYSPFPDRVGLPLYNIPFPRVLEQLFYDRMHFRQNGGTD